MRQFSIAPSQRYMCEWTIFYYAKYLLVSVYYTLLLCDGFFHACLHVPLNDTQNLWSTVGLLCWTFLSFLNCLVTNKVSIKSE